MKIGRHGEWWFTHVIFTGLILYALSPLVLASEIVDTDSGIDFRVRLTTTPGVVSITWKVSKATLNQGANDFALQYYVGGGTQWQEQVSTDEPTDNNHPVLIGGVPNQFCFRMVATRNHSGPILGSGISGNEPPCSAPQPTDYTLTISKAGGGEGTVTSVPVGINCGSDCSHAYTSGSNITLTATAASGSIFVGWSGCSSSSGPTCIRQMNASRVVTATFEEEEKLTVISPVGGEDWMAGTMQMLSWTSQNISGTVSITLLKGGVLDSTIVSNTVNDGSYSWTIPASQAPGNDYKVAVTSDSNNSVTGSSDTPFTINVSPASSNFPAMISIINILLE